MIHNIVYDEAEYTIEVPDVWLLKHLDVYQEAVFGVARLGHNRYMQQMAAALALIKKGHVVTDLPGVQLDELGDLSAEVAAILLVYVITPLEVTQALPFGLSGRFAITTGSEEANPKRPR